MKIKKPYTITESEKNRIIGLHSKRVLNEEMGMMCETCGKVHEGACGGTYETEELEEISDWANDYDDGDDDWREEMGEEMLTDLNGGTYEVAEGRGMVEPTLIRGGGGPPSGITPGNTAGGIPMSTIPGLPKGWKVVTQQEIEEEETMSDLYEVWLGHEETELVSEGAQNINRRPKKEQIYELPRRFGNRRMTESELVNMVNAIVK